MNHLHVNVPDLDLARNFYETYFGFRQVYPESKRLFLKDENDFLLALDPLGAEDQPRFPEWFHFGLCRNDPSWARALFLRMKADGVKFASELEEYESAAVFFAGLPEVIK